MQSPAACRVRLPRAPASSNRSPTSWVAGLSTLITRARRNTAVGGCPTYCSRATMRESKAGEGSRSAEEPDRLLDRRSAARLARHDRLAPPPHRGALRPALPQRGGHLSPP